MGTGLIDADGHLYEDLNAINEHMAEPYRSLRATRRGATANLFPPIGFLNSTPMVPPAMMNRKPEEHGEDPASWVYFLDAVGIEKTVLYPTWALTVNRLRDFEYAIALCRAYNDWVTETYVRHPSGKFQAVCVLPMQEPSAAVEELTRAVNELGLCGAVAHARDLPNHVGSEVLFPVYEAAQALDVGIGFHGAGFEGLGFDDFNVYAPCHALGHPFSQLIAMGGMLFNGVFDHFPKLRVAYLEAGAAWTLMAAERFSESFKAVPPPPSPRILKLADGTSMLDYLKQLMADGRIVIGAEGGEHQITNAIRYFGCQPFMYASDFPHEVGVESCKHELEELNELDIDDESKRLIRGGTAKKFYKL